MPKNIESLIDGYKEFRQQYFSGSCDVFEELVRHGQSPKVLMIACSDSRVDPAIVMNCKPGDLFVVRNVANLVPPYEADNAYHGTSAALEFAVRGLKIHHVVIFGHSQCGGIQTLINQAGKEHLPYSFVTKWMELAQSACDYTYTHHAQATLEEKAHLCGHYAIINSLNNLMTFPWISEGVKDNTLFIHGWFLNLSTGIIDAYNFKSKQFEELGGEIF
ncbi:MAG: carbonic anhydrase [Alphaproteobacteria bacterium]|nr:carbonic anhydrase [Alphaproteobacteria bacterium]